MSFFGPFLQKTSKHSKRHNAKQVEARFLRLYSMWHETHDLTLRKRLLVKLNLLMRRVPDFNLRRSFEQAF